GRGIRFSLLGHLRNARLRDLAEWPLGFRRNPCLSSFFHRSFLSLLRNVLRFDVRRDIPDSRLVPTFSMASLTEAISQCRQAGRIARSPVMNPSSSLPRLRELP